MKSIEQASSAKVNVDKASGKLEIKGSAEQQEKALELLLEQVTYAETGDGRVLKERIVLEGEEVEQHVPPAKVWVRDRDAGKVIGRGGETVRAIIEKTGADIKVQKNEEKYDDHYEREIRIFGTKEQQEQARELVLAEVSWARNENGELKSLPPPPDTPAALPPPAVPPPPEDPRRKWRRHGDGDRAGSSSYSHPSEALVPAPPARTDSRGPRSGLWVCGTCGGDHRTKECPNSTGLLGMGMQLGMQMGMQAMGLQGAMPGVMPGVLPGMLPDMLPKMMRLMHGECSSDSSRSSSSSSDCSDQSDDDRGGGRRVRK